MVRQKQLGNCIGKGQYGSVYKALNLGTGQMVAVKRITLESANTKEIDEIMASTFIFNLRVRATTK